jgi:phage gp29-like protein
MWPFKRTAPPAPQLQIPKLASLDPPAPLPKRAPGGTIISRLQPRGEWSTLHPGWGLTMERIRGAFVQAEQGWPQQQCDIFDDIIERDAHVRSLVEGMVDAVAGKPWIMQAGGEADADDEAAAALDNALRRIPNIAQVWEHLLSAEFYGYAGVEVQWDRIDGWTVPVWMACVPHRRFVFDPETDEPRLTSENNLSTGDPLERGRWIFAARRHRRTARAGIMRTVTFWAWLKSLSVRDWQIFAASYGLPFAIGRHDKDADEETIKILKQAILGFGKQGGAVFSKDNEIEIKEPAALASGNGQSIHPGLVTLCNQEISKVITGATLTSGEGTSVGSYALGRVHQDRSFDKTMGSAERLSGAVQAELGAAFVHFNGSKGQPPRPKVRVVREVDPTARMQIADIAVNKLGMELDEDQFRDEFDLKRPTGKPLKGAPKPEPAAAGIPPRP